MKAIPTDNGSEFIIENFKRFCERYGIKHEKTNPYTPQQNGAAERVNRTVLDGARTILSDSNLDKSFWPEAILAFVHVWNRLCHRGQTKTPIELYTGKKPSIRHLRKFGCTVFVGIPRQLRHKLDAKARKGILVGYAMGTKGYRVWIPESERVVETSNVSFLKNEQHSGAVMAPSENTVYWEMINQGQNSNSDSLQKTSCSSEESDKSEDETGLVNLRDTTWRRKVVPRPDGSRNDIYYYDDNNKGRLRSLNEVENYCKKENLRFNPEFFDFSGKNTYEGPVNSKPVAYKIQCNKSS